MSLLKLINVHFLQTLQGKFYIKEEKNLAKTKTFVMASFSLQTVDIFSCLDHFHARFNPVSLFLYEVRESDMDLRYWDKAGKIIAVSVLCKGFETT